jgi:8-oxo-dGTP diphosphatase
MEGSKKIKVKKDLSKHNMPYYQIPIDKFFQFGLSVDCVVFGYQNGALKVLLIKRGAEPFKGKWALPGDLVYPNEDIEIAARRVLHDLTALDNLYLEQTRVYGQVDRHPIGRVITAGYYALINSENYDPHASAWADSVFWVDVNEIPKLAFDHNQILTHALKTLRFRVRHRPVGFELLPNKFTLGELRKLYEALLNEKYDKANFRKRILSMKLLSSLEESQKDVAHRPARLYSFDKERYDQLKSKGFSFEL